MLHLSLHCQDMGYCNTSPEDLFLNEELFIFFKKNQENPKFKYQTLLCGEAVLGAFFFPEAVASFELILWSWYLPN